MAADQAPRKVEKNCLCFLREPVCCKGFPDKLC